MPATPNNPGVSIQELPSGAQPIAGVAPSIAAVATSITAFIGRAKSGPINTPTTINSFSDYEQIFGGLWAQSTMSFAVDGFFANGGAQAVIVRLSGAGDGDALTAADFIGPGMAANKRGLYSLDNVDLFNILCIAPYTNDDQDVDPTLVAAAAAYCERRRAFYIIDPPSNWTTFQAVPGQSGAIAGYFGTQSSNAAIYFPRVMAPNPLDNNRLATFVPCGIVAGIFARTDAQRGVWSAPAGVNAGIAGVTGLAVSLTDVEDGALNALGVNCLRSLPPSGPVVWGARTLQGADLLTSEWKYVPVRRLALFIEQSLYRGTQWAAFEPNNESLWASLRSSVGAFMQSLYQQGAFVDAAPSQAYFVQCDATTTTAADIAHGIVNIAVGFAPLDPAEFVVIKIQQIAGQSQQA
jgi:phage tail sheath protein FI